MWYEDLTSESNPRLRMVGWLEMGHTFSQGAVDEIVFRKLVELLRDPWQPVVAGGFYSCTLCRFTRGPRYLEWNGTRVEMGCTNLYVPTDQLVYVAPSMILHYIDAHSYLPPMKFCNAVMLCPVMRSIEYLKAVRQTGIAIGNR